MDKKTPILIIAPFFAPQTHAAMFRVHKLVKYLPYYGYKPIVITTDINYNYNEDESLLDEFTKDVEIYRVKYIEPTLRGIRMFLGGKDRTFKAIKDQVLNENRNIHEKKNLKLQKTKLLQKIYNKTIHFIMNMPDAYWTWIKPATNKANELISKYNIKLVYTTTNPNSILKIGINIKNKHGKNIKWISDFRDPVGYSSRYITKNKFFVNYERKLIQNSMNIADHITGLANSYRLIFFDYYKVPNEKYSFIPTGLDEAYLPKDINLNNNKNYFLFAGEFLIEYGKYFFELYKEIINEESFKKLKIYIIGRIEINKPLVYKIISKLKIPKENILFFDHMSQKKLYEFIHNSKACLLISGFNSLWYCNYAKMVDYIALNKPVIAVIPEISEARNELNKANLGIFLTGNKAKDILLLKNFLNNKTNVTPNIDYCNKYLSNHQVKSFVNIFENVLKEFNED